MNAGVLPGVDPTGWPDFTDPVGAQVQAPPVGRRVVAGFDQAVVVRTEQDEVAQ